MRANSGQTSAAEQQRFGRERVLRTISIAEQIADDLASDILDGRRKVGDRLGEEAIAAEFGVSRGPVRTALRALEKKGLAEFFPRRGAFVSQLSTERLRNIMELRFWLLVLGATDCAREINDDIAAEIQAAIELIGSQVDDPEIEAAEFGGNVSALLGVMVRHSGNEQLVDMVEQTLEYSAWTVIWRHRDIDLRSPERRRLAYETLSKLAKAVVAGNVADSEHYAREYLDDAMARSLASWEMQTG